MIDVNPSAAGRLETSRQTLRSERAAVTRQRIASAARALFASNGYGATTLKEIADEAGVAVQTVYAVYRSKAGILQALLEEAVNQPEANALFRQAMAESSPPRRLDLFAHSICERWERAGDIVAIHREAATNDRQVKEGVGEAEGVRRSGLAALAQSLAPALRSDVSPSRAAAILDALTHPVLYGELTGIHRWTPDEYQSWLKGALLHELLGAKPSARR